MRRIIVAAALLAGCSSQAGTPRQSPGPPSTPGPTATTAVAGTAPPATTPSTSTAPPRHVTVVAVHDGLLTADGRTLYANVLDSASDVRCAGGCAAQWPPLLAPVATGTGVGRSDLGTVARPGGGTQVTFDGHPVYRFSGDATPGQTRGDGASGIWHAIRVR